jgi:ribosomal protein S18 acetylase RimI-like enzyme
MVIWDQAAGHGVAEDVMVLPAWRGQNLAKGLIGRGLEYCRSQGIPLLRLEVKSSNRPALSAYSSMGFRFINQETLFGKSI